MAYRGRRPTNAPERPGPEVKERWEGIGVGRTKDRWGSQAESWREAYCRWTSDARKFLSMDGHISRRVGRQRVVEGK